MQIASVASSLAPLAFLACPAGMGLMMWMMARRRRAEQPTTPAFTEHADQPASLEVLREEHARLARQIDRLEAAERPEPRE